MSRPRVLLLWPGTAGSSAGGFGVPQLVLLATYAHAKTGAVVHVRDLMLEAAHGVTFSALLEGPDGRGYDVIGLSCYSSYDYLKCHVIAAWAKHRWPRAVIVAGGYHASARPDEVVYDGSPFDVCVVGEGERPLVRIIESVAGGAPMRGQILGSDPCPNLDELPPTDWSHLGRYRSVARRYASQAQLYLSRGCPFDCAFCMERAKRDVSWRAFSVERAVDEVKRLHAFLDLRSWTLYFADALFGMKSSWRKRFLEALAREDLPIDKIWLLIRVDLVDDDDLDLFHRANCALGFGLESGDPTMLATIRKAGRLDDYLERMLRVRDVARALGLPWAANVIVGHPGETAESMQRSAAYMRKLFLDPRGTTGFLSVDPFRLYPGSPIDADRRTYEATHGAKFHRPSWWHDGDQGFLSEWVDPSRSLSYARRVELTRRLFAPIVAQVPSHFTYRGKAEAMFAQSMSAQVQLSSAPHGLSDVDRYYAWQKYLGKGALAEQERQDDLYLAELARDVRAASLCSVARPVTPDLGVGSNGPRIADILRTTRRELFVPLDAIAPSALDLAVPLDRRRGPVLDSLGVHARLLGLLDLYDGAHVLELGCKSGYMAALISSLVGPQGSVHAIESNSFFSSWARRILASYGNVRVTHGDPFSATAWEPHIRVVSRVHVAQLLDTVPDHWAQILPQGTLVAGRLSISGRIHFVRARVVHPSRLSVELLEEVQQAVMEQDVSEASAGELEPFVRSACGQSARTEPRRLRLLGSGEPCPS